MKPKKVTINPWNMKLKDAYSAVFNIRPDREPPTDQQLMIVINDLAQECYYGRTTYVPNDPAGREQARAEGRREVFLRIMSGARITEGDLSRSAAGVHRILDAMKGEDYVDG